jgi:GNAT superfamily N-acetyltransferase
MPAEWQIQPLDRAHDREHFDCGEPFLNDWLHRFARQSQESGLARTFVAVRDEAPNRVLGFYSLAAGAIDKANLPPSAAKRFPNFPIPVVRLARLAVDRSVQRKGLGEDLMMDALHRSWRASQDLGIAAVLVDAKHDQAMRFYTRYEFEALPDKTLTLWLPIRALARLFSQR